jgi:hypothetical protein
MAGLAREIAGISEDALSRHLKNHLKADIDAISRAMAQARQEALEEAKRRELEAMNSATVKGLFARLEAAQDYFEQIKEIRRKAAELLDMAGDAGDYRAAAPLLKELREQIRLMAELEGKMATQTQINLQQSNNVSIYESQEWLTVGDVLNEALSQYPQAKTAAAIALLELAGKE